MPRPLLLAACVVCFSGQVAIAAANLGVVASDTTPVPGVPTATMSFFSNVGLNNRGDVSFFGSYAFPISNGLFVANRAGDITRVLNDATPIPGSNPADLYQTFARRPYVDEQGNVTAVLTTKNGSVGLWTEFGGTVQQAAIRGQVIPGNGGDVIFESFEGFGGPWVNANGDVAFMADLKGAGTANFKDTGIFTYQGGTLHTLAVAGSQAPGFVPGATFSGMTFSLPVINDSGKIAFQASLDNFAGRGIFEWDGSQLSAHYRKGDAVPGQAGLIWNSFENPDINNNGDIAFQGSTQGVNNSAIWSEYNGVLGMVAHSGAAVGFIPGANYGNFSSIEPVINDLGNVAFLAPITGSSVDSTNNEILFSNGGPSGAHAVLRAGDYAGNGLWGDVHYSPFNSLEFVLNAHGQVAFLAKLMGSDVTTSNDVGLFAENYQGLIEPILREGDVITIAPGIQRTISSITFGSEGVSENTGNSDGRISGFNDSGELAFRVGFVEGGQAILVSHAVPEFGSFAMLAMAGSIGLIVTVTRSRLIPKS